MNPPRPQDLPEIRAQLLNWHHQYARGYFTACVAGGAQRVYHDFTSADQAGRWFTDTEAERIGKAELFYVARNMTELVMTAARSMPDWFLMPEDLPSPYGLIYFEGLPAFRKFPTTAMTWGPCPEAAVRGIGLKGPGIWLSHYADLANLDGAEGAEYMRAITKAMPYPAPPLLYDSEGMAAFGKREDGDVGFYRHEGTDGVVASTNQEIIASAASLVVVKTAWLLMQQGVAEQAVMEPDRAARKRLRREGHEPTPVRVIELRRPKTGGGSSGESNREYHHRWITRGHWRQQWHPKRQVHRPVWIAPHIKGPEGAPLIGGEKVYALKR